MLYRFVKTVNVINRVDYISRAEHRKICLFYGIEVVVYVSVVTRHAIGYIKSVAVNHSAHSEREKHLVFHIFGISPAADTLNYHRGDDKIHVGVSSAATYSSMARSSIFTLRLCILSVFHRLRNGGVGVIYFPILKVVFSVPLAYFA